MLEKLIFRDNPLIFVALVLLILSIAVEVPYRYGRKWITDPRVKDDVWNTLYAGLLALVAFMLALSYAQAQTRFDARRALVVKEADAIWTTWLRADELPPPQAAEFHRILLAYAQKRLEAYEKPADRTAFDRAIARSQDLQVRLWSIASGALHGHPESMGFSLLVESLNETIDFASDQVAALTEHIPVSVVAFTILLVIFGTLFTGFSFARKEGRPLVFAVIYVLALTLVIQMIVDFDRPQTGLVTVNLDPLRVKIAAMQKG